MANRMFDTEGREAAPAPKVAKKRNLKWWLVRTIVVVGLTLLGLFIGSTLASAQTSTPTPSTNATPAAITVAVPVMTTEELEAEILKLNTQLKWVEAQLRLNAASNVSSESAAKVSEAYDNTRIVRAEGTTKIATAEIRGEVKVITARADSEADRLRHAPGQEREDNENRRDIEKMKVEAQLDPCRSRWNFLAIPSYCYQPYYWSGVWQPAVIAPVALPSSFYNGGRPPVVSQGVEVTHPNGTKTRVR